MLSEAQRFWDAISGKVRKVAEDVTKNTFRCERYEVTTAADGNKIGVTLPMGTREIFLPYSKEVANAAVGTPVLVVWWGSMSNAKVYYCADGYRGYAGAAGGALDAYPIGSIYMSVSSTDPGTIFGGTWQRIQDTFLLAAGSTYAAASSGGAATHSHTTLAHALTVAEIPSHTHGSGDDTRQGLLAARTGSDYALTRHAVASGSGVSNVVTSPGDISRPSATGATGGSGSHSHGDTGSSSNMPPYLVVYMWKRTA